MRGIMTCVCVAWGALFVTGLTAVGGELLMAVGLSETAVVGMGDLLDGGRTNCTAGTHDGDPNPLMCDKCPTRIGINKSRLATLHVTSCWYETTVDGSSTTFGNFVTASSVLGLALSAHSLVR
eukprot:COSAG02_NODE_30306_length_553_cov_7.522026_1_plen_122_part_10